MKTVYRSKKYSFLIPAHGRPKHYMCAGDKKELAKRVIVKEKEGYECKYPIRRVVNSDNLDEFGKPDENDCFYETELKKINK
ncbi:hypothetical protein ACTFOB_25445 [Bacillus cereus group sp. MYBK79-1]|uniref:hypothetical protein n=1 Tax=unclassified Bacillus cereus group TaxID=2750818 RepID=UPI003F78B097